MNNLIIFHLLSILLTIVNCQKMTTRKKTRSNFWLALIIGIAILILIILSLILLYIFHYRKQRHEKIKRQLKDYDISTVNDFDTVGRVSEYLNHYSATEVKTII